MYGIDAHVPNSVIEWTEIFLKRFKPQSSLPSEYFPDSLNYFRNTFIDKYCDKNGLICHTDPNINPTKDGFDILISGNIEDLTFPCHFNCLNQAFIENLCEKLLSLRENFTEHEIKDFTKKFHLFMFADNSFSPNYWSLISENDEILGPYFEKRANKANYTWNKKFVLKFLGNQSAGLSYLLSRSAALPFDLNILLSMNEDMYFLMFEFLNTAAPTLMDLEIFSQIVEAGLFPTELIEKANKHRSLQFRAILENNTTKL